MAVVEPATVESESRESDEGLALISRLRRASARPVLLPLNKRSLPIGERPTRRDAISLGFHSSTRAASRRAAWLPDPPRRAALSFFRARA